MNARNEAWYQRWIVREYKWEKTLVPVWDTVCPWLVRHGAYGELVKDPATGKVFDGIYSYDLKQVVAVFDIAREA